MAQSYPTRPIRIVIPFTPGSASDILARLIGPKLYEAWGQQIVVDDRPSAGGAVAGEIVARATADGHTLMLTSSGFAGGAALYDNLPYDAIKDFSGVTQVAETALVLVVAPSLGVKSTKELIALARSKPGYLTFASSGIGSGTHYGSELFKMAAKIDVVHVPFRGTPEAITDTMAGRVHFYLTPLLPVMPLVKSGKLIPLGVTTAARQPLMPDVPAFGESVLPGFTYDGWFGVLAPSKTPRKIVNQLSREIARILSLPDIKERIASQGGTAKSSTPEAFDKLVHGEIATRKKVFKAAGVKPE
ncbi:MAG TPA: tripartite tricarboxylate transporter substrate binding protein [Burkholderiales bacterium]|nr:tripartite tricarboxylate transporter substrate binding protein [Burkholderiales bacterium]